MINNRISIVIPCYKHNELIHQLLWDLYNTNRDIFEVIVVNDGSEDDTLSKSLEWWLSSKMLNLKVITLSKNLGFLKASNLGVSSIMGDKVVLCSTDVRVYNNFTSSLERELAIHPKNIYGARLLSYDTGWNRIGDRIHAYLEGYFLAMTKQAWQEVGGFDERYAPCDMEDVDFSTTAIDKGFTLVQLDFAKVEHRGAASIGYGSEREAITKVNKEKFREKWAK